MAESVSGTAVATAKPGSEEAHDIGGKVVEESAENATDEAEAENCVSDLSEKLRRGHCHTRGVTSRQW